MKNKYLEKVDDFIIPFLQKNGYLMLKSEFVNEYGNWFLRLYIDLDEKETKKRLAGLLPEDMAREAEDTVPVDADGDISSDVRPGGTQEDILVPGIDIHDCAKVSRYLSKWLDREDFIKETYTLEVCSKGFLDNTEDRTEG